MHRAWATGVVAVAVGVALVSCGSSSSSGPAEDAAAGDSALGDGGPACPVAVPTNGTPCSRPRLQCEYGSVDWTDCNTTATCGSSVWSVAPPLTTICANNNTSCPGSASAIAHGGACDHPATECFFREATCACSSSSKAADGGAAWACDDPAPGCPTPRPLLGEPCSQEGQDCDYGACALHNIEQRCTGGVWAFVFTHCDGG